MANSAEAVSSVAQAVNGVTGMVSKLGRNDQQKANSAAIKAAKEAKKLEEKKWPNWATAKKGEYGQLYKKKADYIKAKGEACEAAYQEAYNRVMDFWEETVREQTNIVSNATAQSILVDESNSNLQQGQSIYYKTADAFINGASGRGCVGLAFALVGSIAVLVGGVIYLV